MGSGDFSNGFSTPPVTSSSQWDQPPPSAPRSNVAKWLFIGCGGGLVLMVALVCGILALAFGALRNAEVVRMAVTRASANPEVRAALGTPLKTGWMVSGSINVSGPSGNADMSVPVSGPKGSGTIYLVARKSAGQWTFQQLEVAVGERPERIRLQPNLEIREQ